MLRPKIRIAIYGVFLRKVCLYVGQSARPHERITELKRERGIPDKAALRVLRWATLRNANRLEKEYISKYKAKGQAKFNKRIMGAVSHYSLRNNTLIQVEGYKRPFRGWRDAQYRLQVRAKTLQRAALTGERAELLMQGTRRHVKVISQ